MLKNDEPQYFTHYLTVLLILLLQNQHKQYLNEFTKMNLFHM